MSLANYAILDPTQTQIVAFETMDTASFAAFPAVKAQFYRIVNMTVQPTFDPNTQAVIQNGWTITPVDVEPVWQIVALTAAQQQAVANQTDWNNTIALNLVAACTNAINNWATLTATQKDTILLDLVKLSRAELRFQFGVNN
jgi:hypothetical protein